MTTEEKAKAWDHAVNAFGYLLDKTDLIKGELKENVERIFPELAESEDEKIRKELIGILRNVPNSHYTTEEMAAWLEKQGEQKAAEWSEEDEEHIKSLLARLEGMCKKDATFTRTRFAVSEDKDWLKSLRPQKQWKPSEDQLEALIHAGACEALGANARKLLYSLLAQLKAL